MVCGLAHEMAAKGRATFDSRDIAKMSDFERARLSAYIPSDPTLLFSGIKSTVLGELELAWQLLGEVPNLPDNRLKMVIEAFGLGPFLNRDPFSLSGGEGVRVAIAIAVAKMPQVVAIDQAYDNLDPSAAQEIRRALFCFLPPTAIILETFARRPQWLTPAENSSSHVRSPTASKTEWTVLVHDRRADPKDSEATRAVLSITPIFPIEPSKGAGPKQLILDVQGMRYKYPGSTFELGPLDLKLMSGDRVALIGPNGVGKTTLLKCLAQLLCPTFVRLEARLRNGTCSSPEPKRLHLWAGRVLYSFQNPDDQLYLPTVMSEINETAQRVGRPNANRAREIAEALGLAPFLDHSPFELPRPYRRLVCIASALAADAPILLLDEPSAGLDEFQVGLLIDALLAFGPRDGALMVVSHDSRFVAAVATQTVEIPTLAAGYQTSNPQSAAICPMHS
jgi:energy-coupling factor transporter ATP-binding protein EcfA2